MTSSEENSDRVFLVKMIRRQGGGKKGIWLEVSREILRKALTTVYRSDNHKNTFQENPNPPTKKPQKNHSQKKEKVQNTAKPSDKGLVSREGDSSYLSA